VEQPQNCLFPVFKLWRADTLEQFDFKGGPGTDEYSENLRQVGVGDVSLSKILPENSESGLGVGNARVLDGADNKVGDDTEQLLLAIRILIE